MAREIGSGFELNEPDHYGVDLQRVDDDDHHHHRHCHQRE